MKILLIGFRGTGKTTLGRELAKELNLPFLDADEEIEKEAGRSIKDIVEREGWAYFRNLEKKFLQRLRERENLICALGGGAVLHEEEMEALSKESIIIWVKASLERIKERILRDEKSALQRPPLTDLSLEEELEKLYREREPLYRKWAQVEIDSTEEDLKVILSRLKKALKRGERDGQYYCRGY